MTCVLQVISQCLLAGIHGFTSSLKSSIQSCKQRCEKSFWPCVAAECPVKPGAVTLHRNPMQQLQVIPGSPQPTRKGNVQKAS